MQDHGCVFEAGCILLIASSPRGQTMARRLAICAEGLLRFVGTVRFDSSVSRRIVVCWAGRNRKNPWSVDVIRVPVHPSPLHSTIALTGC